VRGALALAVWSRPRTSLLHAVLTVLAGLVPVAAAWLTKLVLDRLRAGDEPAAFALPVAGLAVAGLVAAVAGDLTRYLGAEVDRGVLVTGQDRLFDAVDRHIGLARFEDPAFLDRLQLAQGPGRAAPGQIYRTGLAAVQGAVTLAGFVVALTAISPVMTALVALAAVPVVTAEWVLSGRRARVQETTGESFRREMFFAQTLVDRAAAQEIRLFGCGWYLRRLMRRETVRIAGAQRAVDRAELVVQAGLALLGAAVAVGGLWWAIGAAAGGRLGLGDLTMFVAAVAGTQTASAALVGQAAGLHEAALMYGHFAAVLETGTDLPTASDPTPLPALSEGIVFHDVWFRYEDGPWVLRGLDLRLAAGASVALVGDNGAGKSTVVKLLCRLYDPTRGRITWDGTDLRDVDPAELRRRIGAVFQDFMHYDLSARDNIALGDLDARDDLARIRWAAAAADIDDRLRDLPCGYDTLLSRTFTSESDKDDPDTGVVLSGGQWQRVALARAFLRDRCELMILDEPSSGLDVESEHRLTEQLRRRRQGRTSLLVSHRLGTLRDADVIAVLAGGRVVEQGDHGTLLAAGDRYAALFDLQARGYAPAWS
jgi:ATP-binding cassette, subfamily B, bacterial